MPRHGSVTPAAPHLLTSLLLLFALGGCAATAPATPNGLPSAAAQEPTSASPATSAPSPSPGLPSPPPSPAAGHQPIVVLDPGHNGGNAGAPAEINRLVPDGRGKQKACNTTGTATNAGYTEHAFTWDVAQRVRDLLAEHGVTVVLTRNSDNGVGPCVNERAAIGNRAGATAVVSIHADGAEQAGAHGFHVAYSSPPLNSAQGGPALSLATTLRDTLRAEGLQPANYIGSQGLAGRSDLGSLNLASVPSALIECANMRDTSEAAELASPAGRQHYAVAIADGILRWLPR